MLDEPTQPPPPAIETRWDPPPLELTGRADGPAPWASFALLCVAAVAGLWASAEFAPPAVTAVVAIAGLAGFWLLLPKSETPLKLPGWALAPLIAAFVAGLFLAGMMGTVDGDLVAAGYWIWFALWLQFGLWLTERFGRPA